MTTDRTALPVTVWSIDAIRTANRMSGGHFFDADTLRFFSSRILPTVHQGRYGVYFVTSERFDEDTPRRYTVRRFDPATGSVDTVSVTGSVGAVSDFQACRTAYVAVRMARGHANHPPVEGR